MAQAIGGCESTLKSRFITVVVKVTRTHTHTTREQLWTGFFTCFVHLFISQNRSAKTITWDISSDGGQVFFGESLSFFHWTSQGSQRCYGDGLCPRKNLCCKQKKSPFVYMWNIFSPFYFSSFCCLFPLQYSSMNFELCVLESILTFFLVTLCYGVDFAFPLWKNFYSKCFSVCASVHRFSDFAVL